MADSNSLRANRATVPPERGFEISLHPEDAVDDVERLAGEGYTFTQKSNGASATDGDLLPAASPEATNGAAPAFPKENWPDPMGEDAFQGVAGDFVKRIAPSLRPTRWPYS